MLAPVRTPAPGVERSTARGAQTGPRDPGRWRRARRIALLAAGLCLIPAAVSFISMLTQRSDSSLGIRSVEWLRDNGARGLVNEVENIYYTLNAPATGGAALLALPKQNGALASQPGATVNALAKLGVRRVVHHYYRPPSIRPVIHPALPGEGKWHPTWGHGGSRPPVLITSFRPDPSYPQLVAGVAWIDHTRTTTWLYPGISEPAVALPDRGPEEIPTDLRSHLVASFNSGFKLQDSGGGVAIGGHTYASMQSDLATILRYRNGKVDVISWQGGPNVGPDVVYARQNLPLIVNHGRPNPNLSDGPEWGATLGNQILVWRSAVGVDKHGNLIYAAAADQSVGSLAAIMIKAGAVRAMELDINTYWTSFISYRNPGAGDASNLLPDMVRSPERYLTPDDRDFFGVYVK
jgi:Phosphodiester glycosidase